jgi:hypothetical protein
MTAAPPIDTIDFAFLAQLHRRLVEGRAAPAPPEAVDAFRRPPRAARPAGPRDHVYYTPAPAPLGPGVPGSGSGARAEV